MVPEILGRHAYLLGKSQFLCSGASREAPESEKKGLETMRVRRLVIATSALAILTGVTRAHVSQLFTQDKQNSHSRILEVNKDQKTTSPVAVPPGNVGLTVGSDGLEFERRLVRGAPFSAVLLIETVRFLPDGTRSARTFSSVIYRDERGRIRRDQMYRQMPPGAEKDQPQRTIIIDPVAGFTYILEHGARLVHRVPITLLSEPGSASSKKTEMSVARAPLGSSEILPLGPVGERVQSSQSMGTSFAPETRQEMLGTREIEGVTTEGSRVPRTIPSAVGNAEPIEAVTERWYSPALQIVILLTQSDPRIGESTYRVTEIKRSDPPARLFAVPADYRIIE